MVKLVIYDLDNTLLNTFFADIAKYNDISLALGMGPIKADTIKDFKKNFLGKTGNQVLQSLFPGRFEEAKKLSKNIDPHIEKITLETGIIQTLEELVNRGIERAIVTNRRESSLRPIIEAFDLLKYFSKEYIIPKYDERIEGSKRFFKNSFIKAKPHPEALNTILALTNTHPKNAIYIGDSKEDMYAAKNAGLPYIGFKTSFNCKIRIEDHRELIKYLEGII